MSKATTPKVLIIDNPKEEPSVIAFGKVEIVLTSSYPLSNFISDSELAEIDPQHYAEIAKQFPSDSEPHKVLISLQQDFEQHLADRGINSLDVSPAN